MNHVVLYKKPGTFWAHCRRTQPKPYDEAIVDLRQLTKQGHDARLVAHNNLMTGGIPSELLREDQKNILRDRL